LLGPRISTLLGLILPTNAYFFCLSTGEELQNSLSPALSTDSGCLAPEDLRCILYIAMAMKRTQLYLDEEMARTLAALGRQKSKTVSELVRESVQEKYMTKQEIDKSSLARHLSGIWRHRKDLKDIERAVRKLRKGNRLKGLGVV